MTRKQFFDTVCARLGAVYPLPEARAIAFVLFGEFYGLERQDIFLYPDAEIGNTAHTEEAVRELERHRPLQYVLGQAWFCDMRFRVNESVLIPRPETEELVRWAVSEHPEPGARVLDIGTGSGCIAGALAKLLKGSRVAGADESEAALRTARENAALNGAEADFRQCDILRETPGGTYDIVVSNPPYVRESEKSLMRRNVLDYEPALALFVEDGDPLVFYRAIADRARTLLAPGGTLYLEINETAGQGVTALLEDYGYRRIELRKDIFDKDRLVRAVWE